MILAIGILVILGAVFDSVANGFSGIHVFFIVLGLAVAAWQFIVLLLTKLLAKTKLAFMASALARISPIILLILVFLIATQVYTPNKASSQTDTQSKKVQMGLDALQQSKYDEAMKILTEVLKDNPLDRKARIGMAEAYQGKKDYKNERIQALELIRFDPHLAKGYELIGDSYWQEADSLRAIVYYQQAVREDENSVRALMKLGTAYGKTQSYGDALINLKQAVELATTDEEKVQAKEALIAVQREIDTGARQRLEDETKKLDEASTKQTTTKQTITVKEGA